MKTLLTLLAIIAIFTLLIRWSVKLQRTKKARIKEGGYDPTQIITGVKYVHGHPEINNQSLFNIAFKDRDIYLLDLLNNMKAVISGKSVTNILVEDAAEFERRITLTRVALIGVFALAFKKRKKVEMAYLTINWNGDKFENATTFEYSGSGSVRRANTDRNTIIKNI